MGTSIYMWEVQLKIFSVLLQPEAIIGERCEVWRHAWQRRESGEAVDAGIEKDLLLFFPFCKILHLRLLFGKWLFSVRGGTGWLDPCKWVRFFICFVQDEVNK